MQGETTIIDLMRHGEPEGGVRIRGWQDDPLSETGWAQMRAAAGEQRPWQLIVTSPLARCLHFAQELGSEQGIPVQLDGRFREIGFGQWEGAEPSRLCDSQSEAVVRFWDDPGAYPPPGGEPFQQFQGRVTEAWREMESSHQGRHILLVAHGAVIRMLVAYVLGMPAANLFRMEVPYAAASRVRIENGVPRLCFLSGRF